MSKKKSASRHIVIDASIARAAGPEDAVHPRAMHSRDFLLTVLAVGHHAVFTRPIKDEWREHRSRFASNWYLKMFRSSRIKSLDDPEDPELRKQVEQAEVSEKQLRVMLKHIHLIEAALASDRLIAALDEAARKCFRAACNHVSALRRICWINPANQAEDPLGWLGDGAPAAANRMLGHNAADG